MSALSPQFYVRCRINCILTSYCFERKSTHSCNLFDTFPESLVDNPNQNHWVLVCIDFSEFWMTRGHLVISSILVHGGRSWPHVVLCVVHTTPLLSNYHLSICHACHLNRYQFIQQLSIIQSLHRICILAIVGVGSCWISDSYDGMTHTWW